MNRSIRGSGVKLTLPLVFRFLGLWLVVTVIVVLVFGVTCYLLLSDRPHSGGQGGFALVLAAQTLCVILAIVILAIFTTHRLAGPLIALRRAFDDVQAGDLERRLRFRRTDPHLLDLEEAFNRMMDTVREQVGRKSP